MTLGSLLELSCSDPEEEINLIMSSKFVIPLIIYAYYSHAAGMYKHL
jgi:hypothetical protein